MSAYNCLANYYNRFTQEDADYSKWVQFVLAQLPPSAQRGVDLACGTGKMTRLLAANRLDVVGMDSSQDMLAQATAQGGKCRYVCQRLQDFSTPSKVDFVTIVNDGVNYLQPNELPRLFQRVHSCLKTGAKLIFDISSYYKLSQVVGNNVFFVDDDDVTCLWSNTFDTDKVQMDLTFFVKQGDLYQRFDEMHVQYAHQTQQVVQLLSQIGFDVVTYDCYTTNPITTTTQRVTFVATKH
ncbi:MAG: class I SAM-dependent methyltransferase [Clostridia bacterium]|nr:class I SAM-dependent methyltransferase [Clostridia bacterium]